VINPIAKFSGNVKMSCDVSHTSLFLK